MYLGLVASFAFNMVRTSVIADTNTLSFTCFYTVQFHFFFKLFMSTNCICICLLCVYCCFSKIGWSRQPVKPPFSTALNKTIRFIWTGSEVLRYPMPCYAMLHHVYCCIPATYASIIFHNLLFTFLLLLNESISILLSTHTV